jgi:hypothetical protein
VRDQEPGLIMMDARAPFSESATSRTASAVPLFRLLPY